MNPPPAAAARLDSAPIPLPERKRVIPKAPARADRPFLSNGLPLLLAMAATFAAVATLAAVGGGWAVEANQYGRVIALGSPAELVAKIGGEHFIEFALNDSLTADEGTFRALPGVVSVRRQEDEQKQREAERDRRAREAEQLRKEIEEEEKKL